MLCGDSFDIHLGYIKKRFISRSLLSDSYTTERILNILIDWFVCFGCCNFQLTCRNRAQFRLFSGNITIFVQILTRKMFLFFHRKTFDWLISWDRVNDFSMLGQFFYIFRLLLCRRRGSWFCSAGSSRIPALMSFFPKKIYDSIWKPFDKEKTHFVCEISIISRE